MRPALTHHGGAARLRAQELMTRCVDKPSDPYVRIDARHWRPYVEVLIRSGVAVRHSADSDMLRLVAFHS